MNLHSILIVDDEPNNFDVIEALLSDQPYRLHYVADGQAAITSLDIFQPDLILLDVMMPNLDGIQVCQRIKTLEQWQAVPIIMVTALNSKEDLSYCLEAGADDFISKPLNRVELRARVGSMLRIKQQYDALKASWKRVATLESEKVELLKIRNVELEKKVQKRTVELKATSEQLAHNALHDPLTNLANRTLMVNRITAAIQQTQESIGYRYALLFLDSDRFKVINDSLGHTVGDQLLQIIAENLQQHLSDNDLVARFGGDEFVILLDDIANTIEAITVAENILAEFQTPFLLNGYELYLGMSIGIVAETRHYQNATDLIRDADIAMYRAKARGKNSYQVFDAAMHIQAMHRLTLESDLRGAIERQEFSIYYQPIINILDNRLVGFEALLRWVHPEHGFISPAEFIPVAEETGLVTAIDHWVLCTASQQLATWQQRFASCESLKLSANLSAQNLRKMGLVEEIVEILAAANLSGDSIILEITESILIEDINQTVDLLSRLREQQIQISVDDFGTGYSSLSYLYRLPVNALKIDRSFVGQMQEDNRNYQVVDTIVTLGRQLGLITVAEGIETREQLNWLRNLGCQYGQGYLFSKPLPADSIERWLFTDDIDQPVPSLMEPALFTLK